MDEREHDVTTDPVMSLRSSSRRAGLRSASPCAPTSPWQRVRRGNRGRRWPSSLLVTSSVWRVTRSDGSPHLRRRQHRWASKGIAALQSAPVACQVNMKVFIAIRRRLANYVVTSRLDNRSSPLAPHTTVITTLILCSPVLCKRTAENKLTPTDNWVSCVNTRM